MNTFLMIMVIYVATVSIINAIRSNGTNADIIDYARVSRPARGESLDE